jgi:DNA replication protein DnaC
MQESIYNIINSRYEAKLPIIVTTNLEKDKMAYSAESIKIRDRFIGMCHFMEVPGESRRRDEYKKLYRDEEDILNS